jgi:hypothetical protein
MSMYFLDCTVVLEIRGWEVEAEDAPMAALLLSQQKRLTVRSPSPRCGEATAIVRGGWEFEGLQVDCDRRVRPS